MNTLDFPIYFHLAVLCFRCGGSWLTYSIIHLELAVTLSLLLLWIAINYLNSDWAWLKFDLNNFKGKNKYFICIQGQCHAHSPPADFKALITSLYSFIYQTWDAFLLWHCHYITFENYDLSPLNYSLFLVSKNDITDNVYFHLNLTNVDVSKA